MADEFPETDLDTPTEHDIDEAYGSQFLGVVDVGDKKIRTKISKVRMEEVKDRDTGKTKKKPVVFFENIDKGLILNVTNKETLVAAFGKARPAGLMPLSGSCRSKRDVWRPEQRRRAFARAASSCAAAKPAPKPATKPPAAAANEWPEEKGDPGPDPTKADFEPAN